MNDRDTGGHLRTSPGKARRPQCRTLALRAAIGAVTGDDDSLSVQQLFYQLVARGVIDETESAYKRVCDLSGQMRLDGSLDYRRVTDGHRSRRRVYAHSSLREALDSAEELYRRNSWIDRPETVEIWCEKDALTGVIQPVCDASGVTYVATRGVPSITPRYESAHAFLGAGKPARIFSVGDHDASGQHISANPEAEPRHFGANVRVHRVAPQPDPFAAHRLATGPGKWSDSRHAAFAARSGDACVELDALPPDVLTDLVERSIVRCIDLESWNRARDIEALERKTFTSLALLDIQPGAVYTLNIGAAA